MAAKKSTSAEVKKAVLESAEDESRCPAKWRGSNSFEDLQHSSVSIRRILDMVSEGRLVVPEFQRPFVWTTEQTVRLIDSILGGFHIGSMLVWEQYQDEDDRRRLGDLQVDVKKNTEVALVIDGQQRLTSIVQAFSSDRFAYDFKSRTIVVDQEVGPDILPLRWVVHSHFCGKYKDTLDFVDWFFKVTEHGEYKYFWLERQFHYYVSFTRMSRRWTIDKVLESYRRMAKEGTPMDLECLEAGLKKWREKQGEARSA